MLWGHATLADDEHMCTTAVAWSVVPCLPLQVNFIGHFDSWQSGHGPFPGKVSALRRLAPSPGAVGVKNMDSFVETMHMFAIHHFLTVSGSDTWS